MTQTNKHTHTSCGSWLQREHGVEDGLALLDGRRDVHVVVQTEHLGVVVLGHGLVDEHLRVVNVRVRCRELVLACWIELIVVLHKRSKGRLAARSDKNNQPKTTQEQQTYPQQITKQDTHLEQLLRAEVAQNVSDRPSVPVVGDAAAVVELADQVAKRLERNLRTTKEH